MTTFSRGLLLASLAFTLGACCQTTTATNDAGGSSSSSGGGGSTGSNSCINVGSCYGVSKCPAGSTCDENTSICCQYAGSNGAGNGGAAAGNGSAGGSGSASSGLSGGSGNGSGGTSATAGSTAASNGGSGTGTAGVTGGASTGGGNNGDVGGGLITGSCYDGGVCPPGSSCSTTTWLCTEPLGGGGSTGQYYWSGTSGGIGGSSSGVVGTCNDGGVCPKNSVCDPTTDYCVANPSGSSGGLFGGGAGGSSTGGAGGGACSPLQQPDPCLPQGMVCDAQNDTCELPNVGQPCKPAVGCQGGAAVTCMTTTDGQSHICETGCTSSAQCSPLTQTCQFNAAFDGGTCQGNTCSDFFGTCNASGNNDGSCTLPPAATIFDCPQQANGCGACVQGGAVPDGQSCDTTRGTNFCQTGSTCMTSPSGDGSTMCASMCSPFNGPTLCPYGYGCYWPIGSNIGLCLLLCPVDPLCPFSIGGDTPGGCSNCNFGASILTGGTVCVMDCPGPSYCQFIPGTPIPACLP